MKYLIVCTGFLFLSFSQVNAQAKFPDLDKSPMDMSYFPNRYPVLKIQDKDEGPLAARIIYGRPQKNNRVIFGNLVEYGKVWRLGANEATEIEFFKDARIDNKKIKKGRYTLYCIPNEKEWTIIINKENDTWGSYKYDEKNDVLRTNVPVQKQSTITESLSMVFDKTDNGANLVVAWDDIKLSLPIVF